MSTNCNIVLRDERNVKKEIVLYRHDDGQPNIMIDMLSKMLSEIYTEFDKYSDIDWFLDPSKVASKLIIKSIHKLPKDIINILPQFDETTRKKLEMYTKLEVPSILPEVHRIPNCNYEYIITLREIIEDTTFRGYKLEVIKLNNNKKVQDVDSQEINLCPVSKPPHKPIPDKIIGKEKVSGPNEKQL